jgi:hypothetical protein
MNPDWRSLGNGIPVQNPEPASLPFAWGVLYRAQNPDTSRKRCVNCIFWVEKERKCVLHSPTIQVDDQDMCGFHVFGKPMETYQQFPGIQYLDPKFSGLRDAGSGVSCANCKYYQVVDQTHGLCRGVAAENRKPPQPVGSLNWCTRYESISVQG